MVTYISPHTTASQPPVKGSRHTIIIRCNPGPLSGRTLAARTPEAQLQSAVVQPSQDSPSRRGFFPHSREGLPTNRPELSELFSNLLLETSAGKTTQEGGGTAGPASWHFQVHSRPKRDGGRRDRRTPTRAPPPPALTLADVSPNRGLLSRPLVP